MNNNISIIDLYTKYKSSYSSSLYDLTKHVILMSFSFYFLHYYRNSYYNILFCIIMSLFVVRTFIIYHDCCHNSYTPNKTLNYILSNILGIFCLTSPNWGLLHKIHHKTSGNIDNKFNFNFNEMVFTTVNKFNKFTKLQKNIYLIIYYPLVFFSIIPFIYFFILHRGFFNILFFSYNRTKIGYFNYFINNLSISILYYILYKYEILFLFLISQQISSSIGFLLFYCQHTFNPSYVVNNEEWTLKNSGLQGSSFIQVPLIIKYFTMGIEYHHIHHMNSLIPGYNLKEYHDYVILHSNMFDNIIKLSMKDCYNNIWLNLYDEDKKMFVSY